MKREDGKPSQGRKAIAIAGVRGGMGKTVVTLGLIRSLCRKKYSVAPFKKGPDYIDPAWLSLAAGRYCHNLDTFLMDDQTTRSIYESNHPDTRLCVLEGNRGLYDGYNVDGTHSFAELSKLLDVPVILVVDCTKASRTVAALVLGVKMFDPDLRIRGVILNNLAGERHRALITEAVQKYTGLPVLGSVPRIPGMLPRERHLGLVPVFEHEGPEALIESLADIIEKSLDLERIIEIAGAGPPEGTMPSMNFKAAIDPLGECITCASTADTAPPEAPLIGVLRDSAFNFYYRENIEALVSAGGRIVEISPLSDHTLPDVDGLYVGGGFPETHAESLSNNRSFREQLRRRIEDGLPVYAECGGLIYLSDSIIIDGNNYPMTRVFPMMFDIAASPQGHGYTVFEVDGDNPFYDRGDIVKGHEFRYARIQNSEGLDGLSTVFAMRRGTGIKGRRDGALYKNVVATFCHTHAAGENVRWPERLVGLAGKRIKAEAKSNGK
ncbi:MAG: cobyrinate a,c-diamide synthase [Spirochaetes bacterium]|nr:cobyrinate a,c-diamide synthase [Spirochaetota bacterium]